MNTAPCQTLVRTRTGWDPCGRVEDVEWLHYNRDDSRAIDHPYRERACRPGGDDPETTDPSWCVEHDNKWPGNEVNCYGPKEVQA